MRTKISLKLKKGSNKSIRAISPVIATIILIAVALVLALVVGVFAFGLFTANTKNVALKSANLYAATPGALNFTLSNPGSANTAVTSVALTGYLVTSCGSLSSTTVTAGTISSFKCTPNAAPTVGDTYDYVINLANGQSISGSAVAQ